MKDSRLELAALAKGNGVQREEGEAEDQGGEGLSSKHMEAALRAETSSGRCWHVPYGYLTPHDTGATGGREYAFRFMLDDAPHLLVIEGDGSKRFQDIVLQICRSKRISVRAAGCVRRVDVRKA